MKTNYSSRQKKIYQDYYDYSTNKLIEIVNNRKEYLNEVIEIIEDILEERKMNPDNNPDSIRHDFVNEKEENISEYEKQILNKERFIELKIFAGIFLLLTVLLCITYKRFGKFHGHRFQLGIFGDESVSWSVVFAHLHEAMLISFILIVFIYFASQQFKTKK